MVYLTLAAHAENEWGELKAAPLLKIYFKCHKDQQVNDPCFKM